MSIVDDYWLSISQALVTYLSGNADLTSRAYVSVTLDTSMIKHPRYPATPITECPCVILRNYKSEAKREPAGGIQWTHWASLWVYRSRPTSGSPQADIMTDLRALRGIFEANHNPSAICAAGCEFLEVTECVVHDELAHPYDEPRLRVMVGEALLKIKARRL